MPTKTKRNDQYPSCARANWQSEKALLPWVTLPHGIRFSVPAYTPRHVGNLNSLQPPDQVISSFMNHNGVRAGVTQKKSKITKTLALSLTASKQQKVETNA